MMIHNKAFWFVVVWTIINTISAGKVNYDRCPPQELLSPCYCNTIPIHDDRLNCSGQEMFTQRCQSPVITCIDNGHDKLKQIFSNLSKRIHNIRYQRFEWFYLIDHMAKILYNNLLENFNFRNIYLKNCPNLRVINVDAFGQNNSNHTQNVIINASRLSDNIRLKRETFKAFSSFKNLDTLEIQTSGFKSIPVKAFNKHNNIQIIRFYNPDLRQNLQKISTKAFFKANGLREIDFKNNKISQISAFAFQFQRHSKHQLDIFLSGNLLRSDSFDAKAFDGGNGRNVTLYLGDYDNCNSELRTLRQSVFESFLQENRGNVIDMYGCPLQCDHQMNWIIGNIDRFKSQLRNLVCYNQPSLMNSDNYNYYHSSN